MALLSCRQSCRRAALGPADTAKRLASQVDDQVRQWLDEAGGRHAPDRIRLGVGIDVNADHGQQCSRVFLVQPYA